MSLHELRSLIGYVPQKGMLFSGDIEGNIAYGDPDMSHADVDRGAIAIRFGIDELGGLGDPRGALDIRMRHILSLIHI